MATVNKLSLTRKSLGFKQTGGIRDILIKWRPIINDENVNSIVSSFKKLNEEEQEEEQRMYAKGRLLFCF